jgi:hypothetical protein
MLDFLVFDTHNPQYIAFLDISQYTDTPPNLTLEVTAPGYNRVTVVVQPNEMTLLTGPLLQMDCDPMELPDGLYYFKLEYDPVYENYKEGYYYRTEELEARLDEKFLQSNLSECGKPSKSDRMAFTDAYLYLKGCKAAAKACDYKLAERLYRLADSHIKSIKPEKGGC